jgi:hypothetical protein
LRLSIGGGVQATTPTFLEDQTFQQYLETGSFAFEHSIPRRPIFDGALTFRVFRRLYVGTAVTILDDRRTGTVTAQVPHPLIFNQLRTTTGEVPNSTRFEAGVHFQASWTIPMRHKLEFTAFGGPSLFVTQQTYVSELALGLEREVYPFDTFTFAGAATDTFKGNIIGYNAGGDLTWRFKKKFGAGLLLRYAHGSRNFTPPGGTGIPVQVGGVHVTAGVRVML